MSLFLFLEKGLTNHIASLSSSIRNGRSVFEGAAPVYVPTSNIWEFLLFCIFVNTSARWSFHFSHSSECECTLMWVSFSDNDIEDVFVRFLTRHVSSSVKVYWSHSISNGLLSCICRHSLGILEWNFLEDNVYCKYFLLVCGLCHHFLFFFNF